MSEAIDICHAIGCRQEIYPHEEKFKCKCCDRPLCKSCHYGRRELCARCEFDSKMLKIVSKIVTELARK